MNNNIYSDTGTRFGASYEVADQSLGSDFSFSRSELFYRRSSQIGSRAHQTLEWSFDIAEANNGPDNRADYGPGGTHGLRGYPRRRFEADFCYLASATYLRPLYGDWLRLALTLEAGTVYSAADELDATIRSSFDVGLRVRLPRFVNVEFEFGLAIPLAGDSPRVYASRFGF